MVDGGSGVHQWLVAMMGGRKFKIFVPNELKSPKNNMFFCSIHIWGVVGSDPNIDISIFFFIEPFSKYGSVCILASGGEKNCLEQLLANFIHDSSKNIDSFL